ncbi:hypothetical protein [Arcicella rigui]|uniref:Uncharacterized protein n=1 Tax=Arcicella rigui TaxID=797020 RepID=A0ABU5Q6Q5_9BACT|nr:hypothetical protein [Arcicella rigui]MEA5138247.1 hypothetical protein [Arcicella rigui]
MQNYIDIQNIREQNKIGLETYFLDKTNMFDIAIDKLIEDLKTGINNSHEQFDNWNELKETYPKRYAELVEEAERYEINIDHQKYDYILDIIHNQEQLLSLIEMKVIYAFKSLEIHIKNLLKASFNLKSTKDFYKWDNLIKFLEDKNIQVKTLNSYNEIVQLKSVNNAIKHSNDYEVTLTSIQEFKTSDKLTYAKVDKFYKRIKDKPNHFLQELISVIYNELYEFDDLKIKDIAESLALRMKKEDAKKLILKIEEQYE